MAITLYHNTSIKVRDLEMRELPGIIQVGPKCHHKCLYRRSKLRFDTDTKTTMLKMDAETEVVCGPQGLRRPCKHLEFDPLKLTSDFWPPKLGENKFLLF